LGVIEKKLSNGITLVMEEIKNTESVSFGIFIGTGSKFEEEDEKGISHLIEHMLFKGTTKRSAKEISEELDTVGANINAYTSKETTAYYVQTLAKYLDETVEILSDMFMNSTYTEENLTKEKKVVVEEINMYEDIPEEMIHEYNSLFALEGNQSNGVLGTEESVNSHTKEKILKYLDRKYVPNNIVVSVAGKIDSNETYEMFEKYFGALKREERVENNEYPLEIKSGHKEYKRDTHQVHLCVNSRGLSFLDDDRYVLSIISNILGGNMSSRLFQKIREERGLAYSVYSYSSSYKEDGLFTVYAGTTEESYKEVVDLIKDEFKLILENGYTEKELIKAKNQLLSSITFGLETNRSRMTKNANSRLIYGKLISIEETINEIEKIKLEDLDRVSKKLFDEK